MYFWPTILRLFPLLVYRAFFPRAVVCGNRVFGIGRSRLNFW